VYTQIYSNIPMVRSLVLSMGLAHFTWGDNNKCALRVHRRSRHVAVALSKRIDKMTFRATVHARGWCTDRSIPISPWSCALSYQWAWLTTLFGEATNVLSECIAALVT
jgi:hypothetical protein